jgi:hypothetical protein
VVGDEVIDYAPTARPGHRAPHLRLLRDGHEISSLDLFDGSFALLAGATGSAWRDAAREVAGGLGVPLQAFTVGPSSCDIEDIERRWPELYGVGAGGAVLVRPDGHVGWRVAGEAPGGDPGAELERALGLILGG